MIIKYNSVESWPPLAWIARLIPGSRSIEVFHGPKVEIQEEWFAEAVWAGDFPEGNFDKTDIVAGSGVRLRPNAAFIVSSGSTVDRLVIRRDSEAILVSNSIPCILEFCDTRCEAAYPHYHSAFWSIINGINDYQRNIPCEDGCLELVYFDNLLWDGKVLSRLPKPDSNQSYSNFREYECFLNDCMEAMVSNMEDPLRKVRYKLLGTLSTGYDSTTVTAVAKPFGLENVICYKRPDERDFAGPIASMFGVKPITVGIDDWKKIPEPEIPFIAANSFGEEVHICPAEKYLADTVLLTGFHGDKVWDYDTSYISSDIKRGDASGLGLSEYRLITGTIHCAVPFWGVRRIAAVKRISNLEEMQPWNIGGGYNRPICRRIVESYGIPREAFGQEKSFASQWLAYSEAFLTPDSLKDFLQWIKVNKTDWHKLHRPAPSTSRALDSIRTRLVLRSARTLARMPGLYRGRLHKLAMIRGLLAIENRDYGSPSIYGARRYVFPWAAERARRYYKITAASLSEPGASGVS